MVRINVAISGSTGLIGQALSNHLRAEGYEIISVKREDFQKGAVAVHDKIRNCQIVINLAGSPVIKRWTGKNKHKILESRINTTNLTVEAMQRMDIKPRLFINASAVGIYDDMNIHIENSKLIDGGFLGDVVQKWETAALKGGLFVKRLVLLRIGVVLSFSGGAVKKVWNVFRFGLGGYLGNGKQKMAFVHIDDLCRIVQFLIENENVNGVVNAVAPAITTNKEYSRALAGIFGWKHLFYIPGFVLKILFGRAAIVLLRGQNVVPEKLITNGFIFRYHSIYDAVNALKQ